MPIVFARPKPDTAWDVTAASFVQSEDVSTEQSNIFDISFKADGTKMFVMGTSPARINQYSLSTAWDISTASILAGTHTITTLQNGMFFKEDGTTMYIADRGVEAVRAYDLPTPWDISVANQTSVLVVELQDTAITDVYLKSDGTKMYTVGLSNDRIYQYSLPTPWVLTGGSYEGVSKAFNPGSSYGGLAFRDDGSSFYLFYNSTLPSHRVFQYNPDTDWVINPSTVVGSFDTTSQTTNGRGMFFSNDGKRMYLGNPTGSILQYSL